jgi:hypothetical protein
VDGEDYAAIAAIVATVAAAVSAWAALRSANAAEAANKISLYARTLRVQALTREFYASLVARPEKIMRADFDRWQTSVDGYQYQLVPDALEAVEAFRERAFKIVLHNEFIAEERRHVGIRANRELVLSDFDDEVASLVADYFEFNNRISDQLEKIRPR